MKIRSLQQYSSRMLCPDKSRPASFYRIVLLSLSLGLTSFSLNVNAASLTLVTKDGAGNPGNAVSSSPSISNNGRYVLYHSEASNLVDGDTNNATDVFLYDRPTGVTYRITQGNDDSVDARISNNLKYVVFSSFASNLVDEGGNSFSDIFLYETKTGAIKKISVDSLGTPGNSGSFTPSISSNGRYVVYESNANNLVPGDNNNNRDIFLYDKKIGITALVSADSSGAPGNNTSNFARISGNGRYVVYQSDATNLVGDGNGASDIFLFDKKQRVTYLISSSINGQGNGSSITPFISNNGRYIVYASAASNLVNGDGNGVYDIFLYDTNTRVTRMVSVNNTTGQQGNGESLSPRISGNGRYIVYSSAASNLVDNDTNNLPDIFRYDTKTGVTTRVSVRGDGVTQGTGGGSFSPGISNNGRYTVYESFADNLADGDFNATSDIFLYNNK
ncbi:MAG: TolB family protein [Methylosarcina sp.]